MLFIALCIYAPLNIASVLVKDNFWVYLPLWSIPFGIMNGLTYMVPMHHGWLWYPNRPGLISGIIVGGFGLGSLVFSLVLEHIVNPNGLKNTDPQYHQVVKDNVPFMKLIFCISNIASSLLGILTVFHGPDATRVSEVKKTLENNPISAKALSQGSVNCND